MPTSHNTPIKTALQSCRNLKNLNNYLCRLPQLNVTDDKALFQKAIDVSGGISTFGNICTFDSTGDNNRCIFHPTSTLDICGNFNLGNFSTPGFQTRVIRSENDVGNNVQLNIYDDFCLVNTHILGK